LIIKIFIVCNKSIIIKKVCLIVNEFTQPHLLFLWLQHIAILSKDKPFQIDTGKFICFYNICRHHTVNFRSSPWTKYWTQHTVFILMLLSKQSLYYPTNAQNIKNVELLQHIKIMEAAPTCFCLQRNHHQGATASA
jgi:hypothetical protein